MACDLDALHFDATLPQYGAQPRHEPHPCYDQRARSTRPLDPPRSLLCCALSALPMALRLSAL
eukprot:4926170-Prymnesium_polylepis.2